MKNFSLRKINTLKKMFSGLALAALVLGTFSTLVETGTVYADTQPTLSVVGVMPTSGMISSGGTAEVFFREASGQTNLTLAGACTVNNADVSGSFQNLTDGLYKVVYTVGLQDMEQPAGNIPVSCTLGNASSTVQASAWTDGNTLAIDTNGDGTVDNGTNTLGFTAVASPNAGTVGVGEDLVVSFQDPIPSSDMVVGTNGCKVNDVDVASTYTYHGSGLYTVKYTVGANDTNRAAGQIPLDCTLENSSNSAHIIAFTDSNTTSVNTNTGALAFTVGAMPNAGTRTAGQNVEVYFDEAHDNTNIVLDGACIVNGKDVAGTFENLTDGLYKVTYNVTTGDTEREAGDMPISCMFKDWNTQATTSIMAFTDNNTLEIDTDGDGFIGTDDGNGGGNNGGGGGNGTTTNAISFTSVGAIPMTGTLNQNANLQIYFQAGTTTESNLTLGNTCTVNGRDVSSTFSNLTDGLYRVIYTVGASDSDRAAGQVPLSCMFEGASGATTTVSAFTTANTVAIDVNGDGNNSSTGGSIGGNVNGGSSTTTQATLGVTGIEQTQTLATAGGGFSAGWKWTFNITVPDDETSLAMKFDNWTHSNGSTTMATANNVRISSAQANPSSTTLITAPGTYSSPLTLTGDMDANTPGRQIEVLVEAQIPSGTLNGAYTTNYGVKSY